MPAFQLAIQVLFFVFQFMCLLIPLEPFAGGIFALYALLCRNSKVSLLPNHQAADEEISTYHDPEHSSRNAHSSRFKAFIERNRKAKTGSLVFVLLGISLVFSVGVFRPVISNSYSLTVLSSIDGLQVKLENMHIGMVVFLACLLLISLIIIQGIFDAVLRLSTGAY
ncbi:hypothetical protein Q3G72_033049 [Acer saccharum]|nr:hypothetical protein Q3G72_033049 [Acer saccharum]